MNPPNFFKSACIESTATSDLNLDLSLGGSQSRGVFLVNELLDTDIIEVVRYQKVADKDLLGFLENTVKNSDGVNGVIDE
jgi:hypothetical protein